MFSHEVRDVRTAAALPPALFGFGHALLDGLGAACFWVSLRVLAGRWRAGIGIWRRAFCQ